MRVAVTGGAGFIGSHVSNKLALEKREVIAIDNLTSGDWVRCNPEINRLNHDLSKLEISEISDLFKGCEEVYHLAAVKLHNQKNSAKDVLENNIRATQKIFEACGIAGVKRVFFSSSLYAYGYHGPGLMIESNECSPMNEYGLSKLWGEHNLRIAALKHGMQFVNGRLFFVYGPNQYAEGGYKSVIVKSCQKLKQDEAMEIYGTGSQILDYIYVEDCVKAIIGLMKLNTSITVNISSGRGTSIRSLVDKLNKIHGGGEIVQREKDWTDGTVRVGDNQKLKMLLPNFEFTSLSHGLEMTYASIK